MVCTMLLGIANTLFLIYIFFVDHVPSPCRRRLCGGGPPWAKQGCGMGEWKQPRTLLAIVRCSRHARLPPLRLPWRVQGRGWSPKVPHGLRRTLATALPCATLLPPQRGAQHTHPLRGSRRRPVGGGGPHRGGGFRVCVCRGWWHCHAVVWRAWQDHFECWCG